MNVNRENTLTDIIYGNDDVKGEETRRNAIVRPNEA